MRRTTIIATIGPASSDAAALEALVGAGVEVFRLNFSHGDHAGHEKVARRIRGVEKKTGRHIAIMMDLQGPKIRVGAMPEGGVMLRPGRKVTIVTEDVTGSETVIPTIYRDLPRDVKRGRSILINDGYLELKVLDVSDGAVACRVTRGGPLTSHKGINLPGTPVSAPSLTTKDIEDLRFGLGLGVDYVAMSFVRRAADVEALKKKIRSAGADTPVIAKIERPEALRELHAILDAAEGVMVARGDLGVEMPPEQVPEIQKRIIEEANQRGRQVITATQMLESMISSARPTRAEASDVANAVFDGTGAVMLSGETSVGKYPVETVRMMSRIALQAEKRLVARPMPGPSRHLAGAAGFSGAVAYAAARAARELNARAILTFTQSGTAALLVSKYRPACPVIGATLHRRIARRMSLYWGVVPLIFDRITSTESLVRDVDRRLLKTKLVRRGDVIVITSGVPVGKSGTTNLMKIHRVGESD